MSGRDAVKQITQIGMLALAAAIATPAMGYQGAQKSTANAQENGRSGSSVRFQGPHAGDWLRRNMNTSPAQQKQELEKDDQFKKLPAEKQQQLMNSLNRFNSMTPQQKSRMLSHMEWLEHLPADKKQKAD